MILPTALKYHTMLAQGAAAAKSAGLTAPQSEVAEHLAKLIAQLTARKHALHAAFVSAEAKATEEAKAEALAHEVSDAMLAVREICDALEGVVADELWPLPKYREMLFLS